MTQMQQGHGPPKGKTGSELFAKLMERPRPTTRIPFPVGAGKQSPGDIILWVLTEAQMMFCRATAEMTAKALLNNETHVGDLGYEEIYRQEMVIEMMAIACRDPEDTNLPIFPTGKHMRDQLTTDEIGVICVSYNEHRRMCGPMISMMTEEELEAWEKLLVEGASIGPLAFARHSSEAKTDLILHLASRLRTLLTGSGSAGSPPDDSSLMSTAESPRSKASLVGDDERPKPTSDE